MSVLEAMSVGKPVILANTCGLAGFVESTNSGLIVDDSVDSLSAAISKLLDDSALRKTMGANAMRAVRDRYGMVAIVDRLLGLYEGVKVA
jgi:glycosyltransferase involved in cell wall biosynthesis